MDDAVIREVLGKKLSSRHRKDLDEVTIYLCKCEPEMAMINSSM